VWAGVREFLLRFVYRKGFRDGWLGFYLTMLMVAYRTVEVGKIAELQEGRSREANRRSYQEIANSLLLEHDCVEMSLVGVNCKVDRGES
jgi:hypothetical protein